MREKRGSADQSPQADEQQEVGGKDRLSLMGIRHKQRRQTADVIRGELRERVGAAARAVGQGCNLFQSMVRADGEEVIRKQLEPDLVGKIKDKVVDKVFEKFKDGVEKVTAIGEEIVKRSTVIFGTIKGAIDKNVQQRQQLTVLELADAVSDALQNKALELEHVLTKVINELPMPKILAAGKVLDAAESAADTAGDQDDSEERGELGEGLRQRAAVEVLGLPEGDLVAAEGIAKNAYDNFFMEVAASGTAQEQTDAIQKQLKNPHGTQDKLEREEKRRGEDSEFGKTLQRDKTLRARVNEVW